MYTRFRFVAFALVFCGLAAAQAKPKPKKPEPKVPGLQWTASQLATFGFSLYVGVRQEPPRLGPGQRGNLILTLPSKGYWGPGGNATNRGIYARFAFRPAFRVKCDRADSAVTVFTNQASWAPPKDGRTTYQDMVVIQVPITVARDAQYGLHDVTGTIEVSGSMHEPESIYAGQPHNTPANRYLTSLGVKTGSVSFSGKIKVGKPMPEALPAMVSNEAKTSPRPIDASASKSSAPPTADKNRPEAHAVAAKSEKSEPDAPRHDGNSEPPGHTRIDIPKPEDNGFPFEWLAAAVVLALAMLLLIKARGQ